MKISSENDRTRNEKELINKELNKLNREIEELDDIMKSYYSNPEAYLEANRNIRPTHKREALVRKIRNYQIKAKEMVGSAVSSLYGLLDRIQWKTHYYNKTWIQWEKLAEDKIDQCKRKNIYYYTPEQEVINDKKKNSYSMDMLYDIQKKKYEDRGMDPNSESKIEFEKRILDNFKEVRNENNKSSGIVMFFDEKKRKCRLKYDQRQYD